MKKKLLLILIIILTTVLLVYCYRNNDRYTNLKTEIKIIDSLNELSGTLMNTNQTEALQRAELANSKANMLLEDDFYKRLNKINLLFGCALESLVIEKGSIWNNLGMIYESLGNYPLAFENLCKAKNLYEEEKDIASLATVYNNFSVFYKDITSYELAIKYLLKAKEIDSVNNNLRLVNYCINLGDLYLKIGKIDSALHYTNTGQLLLKRVNTDDANDLNSVIINNFANIHFSNKQYDSAVYMYNTVLAQYIIDTDTYCEATLGIAKSYFDAAKKLNNANKFYTCPVFSVCAKVTNVDSILKYAIFSFDAAKSNNLLLRKLEASKFLSDTTLTQALALRGVIGTDYYQRVVISSFDTLYGAKMAQLVDLTNAQSKSETEREREREYEEHINHEIVWILCILSGVLLLVMMFLFFLSYDKNEDGDFFTYIYINAKITGKEFVSDTREKLKIYFTTWAVKSKFVTLIWGGLIFVLYELVIKSAEISTLNVKAFLGKFAIQILVGIVLVRIHHFLLHKIKHDDLFHEKETKEHE